MLQETRRGVGEAGARRVRKLRCLQSDRPGNLRDRIRRLQDQSLDQQEEEQGDLLCSVQASNLVQTRYGILRSNIWVQINSDPLSQAGNHLRKSPYSYKQSTSVQCQNTHSLTRFRFEEPLGVRGRFGHVLLCLGGGRHGCCGLPLGHGDIGKHTSQLEKHKKLFCFSAAISLLC